MAGFGVLITFGFIIYIVSWDRLQLVGLSIPRCFIAKASYARHCTNTNVTINWVSSVDSEVKEKVFGRLKNESSLLRRQFIHGGQIFGTSFRTTGADNLFKVFGSQTNE